MIQLKQPVDYAYMPYLYRIPNDINDIDLIVNSKDIKALERRFVDRKWNVSHLLGRTKVSNCPVPIHLLPDGLFLVDKSLNRIATLVDLSPDWIEKIRLPSRFAGIPENLSVITLPKEVLFCLNLTKASKPLQSKLKKVEKELTTVSEEVARLIAIAKRPEHKDLSMEFIEECGREAEVRASGRTAEYLHGNRLPTQSGD